MSYYVSGCIEIEGTVGHVEDADAEFFTLYERKESGLSHALLDCGDRLSVEAAMAVYVERDALAEQVRIWELRRAAITDTQLLKELALNITEQIFDTGAADNEATKNALAFVVSKLKPVFERLESVERERDELRKTLTSTQDGAAEAIKHSMQVQGELARHYVTTGDAVCRISATEMQRLKEGCWAVVDIPSRHPTDMALYAAAQPLENLAG